MNITKLTDENYIKLAEKAALIIKSGGVVLAPFDTVYGFIANPFLEKSLLRVFYLKKRPLDQTIGLATDSSETIEKLTTITESQLSIIRKKTPGPFTFILPVGEHSPISNYCLKNKTAAIRIPDNELILAFTQKSGGLVAQTSANKTGMPNCYSIEEINSQFSPEELDTIDLIIDGGEIDHNAASTIIDLTGKLGTIIRK